MAGCVFWGMRGTELSEDLKWCAWVNGCLHGELLAGVGLCVLGDEGHRAVQQPEMVYRSLIG